MTAPYWTSVTKPCAFLRSRFTTTISRAEPRETSAVTHADPTAPAPITPTFILPLAFYPDRKSRGPQPVFTLASERPAPSRVSERARNRPSAEAAPYPTYRR